MKKTLIGFISLVASLAVIVALGAWIPPVLSMEVTLIEYIVVSFFGGAIISALLVACYLFGDVIIYGINRDA